MTICCTPGTGDKTEQAKADTNPVSETQLIDSLDTDTSQNYILLNLPAYLHAESDTIINSVRSNIDSGFSLPKLRASLISMNFIEFWAEGEFHFEKRTFNRRRYVVSRETEDGNKKIIIESNIWEKGKKYRSIYLFLTNP
jgi:hypothetical protein